MTNFGSFVRAFITILMGLLVAGAAASAGGRWRAETSEAGWSDYRLVVNWSTQPHGPWKKMLQARFPGMTFLATILPHTVRSGNRFTLGFTGGRAHDALNLVDARIVRR